jgi:hypothetical protein
MTESMEVSDWNRLTCPLHLLKLRLPAIQKPVVG